MEELGISLHVVLGDQRCGGVKAACSGDKASSPNLKALVKTIRGAWIIRADDRQLALLDSAVKRSARSGFRNGGAVVSSGRRGWSNSEYRSRVQAAA